MIRILAIGKKHESWVAEGIERYLERLKQPYDIRWELLPHSSFEATRAREEESERLLPRIGQQDFVVLLDETGKMHTTPEISELFEKQFTHGRSVVLVIGGAYGVSPALHARADMVWSLSPLVFPHQLVRLIAAEQLYRAQEIARGGAYHHE